MFRDDVICAAVAAAVVFGASSKVGAQPTEAQFRAMANRACEAALLSGELEALERVRKKFRSVVTVCSARASTAGLAYEAADSSGGGYWGVGGRGESSEGGSDGPRGNDSGGGGPGGGVSDGGNPGGNPGGGNGGGPGGGDPGGGDPGGGDPGGGDPGGGDPGGGDGPCGCGGDG